MTLSHEVVSLTTSYRCQNNFKKKGINARRTLYEATMTVQRPEEE
jgi:hypothetical protein